MACPWVNAAAWLALLWCERRRLPLQNVAALGMLSAILGLGIECAIAHAAAIPSWRAAPWCMATGWPVAWLGARALARGIGGKGLGRRTLLLGLLLLPGLDGPTMSAAWPGAVLELGWLGARAVAMALGFLLLGPWWIRKQASPAPPSPWFAGWIAPGAGMVHALFLFMAGPGGWRGALPLAAGSVLAGCLGLARGRTESR